MDDIGRRAYTRHEQRQTEERIARAHAGRLTLGDRFKGLVGINVSPEEPRRMFKEQLDRRLASQAVRSRDLQNRRRGISG